MHKTDKAVFLIFTFRQFLNKKTVMLFHEQDPVLRISESLDPKSADSSNRDKTVVAKKRRMVSKYYRIRLAAL